ncbi:MAG: cytochrome P450, partial [Halioglobus sp.]
MENAPDQNLEEFYRSPTTTPEADPWAVPLEDIDLATGSIFQAQKHHEYFKRLRQENPVHYHDKNPDIGPYWSLTRYEDILAVDSDFQKFSSEPSIALFDELLGEEQAPMFIAMDPPKHDVQRETVQSAVDPVRLKDLDQLIRKRTVEVLDELPIGTPFNWVDKVSIELTTRMLATLFDFPFEERSKLTFWSDIITTPPILMGLTIDDRLNHLADCLQTFTGLFKERQFEGNDRQDFISLLANNPATADLDGVELLGNLMLLIVGGNDTTRNSMSAGVLFMHENPSELQKIKDNEPLVSSAVSEIIRYQTPLSYMRRTANEDVEIGGKQIKKGEKIAMWYASGNRDESFFPDADKFIIDRPNVRRHMAFGFGVHRCMGNRVAEAQLRIVWE